MICARFAHNVRTAMEVILREHVDNLGRRGEVVKPKTQHAKNVVFYNQQVAKHPRLESVVVPIRDGLSVARVKD